MKMFGKKSVSTLLFYVSTISFWGYFIFTIILSILLITNQFTQENGDYFQVSIPFTGSVIKGINHPLTLLAIIAFFLFYSAFFYLLTQLFKTFKAEKLFTENAIVFLKRFTILNLIVPLLYLIIGAIATHHISTDDLISGLLHVFLGIFAAFIAAIFKLGYRLQEENDLTI